METLDAFYTRMIRTLEPAIIIMEQAAGRDDMPQPLQDKIANLAQQLSNVIESVRGEAAR